LSVESLKTITLHKVKMTTNSDPWTYYWRPLNLAFLNKKKMYLHYYKNITSIVRTFGQLMVSYSTRVA